jgi:hypothetical protein
VIGGSSEATGTPRHSGALHGIDPDPAGTELGGDSRLPAPGSETFTSAVDATRFAHASEAEMARILDFYQVRWEYEPTTFPILWNLDGEVVESFAPDFYLPDLEVFLEMTTLKQRLVRKKNRKLRRLRELYPDIRIKLFYARDFRAMMLKYGRLGLAESLSGTLGQVVPERPPLVEQEGPEPAVAAPEPATGPAGSRAADGPRPDVSATSPAPVQNRTDLANLPRAAARTRSGRRRRTAVVNQAGAELETDA